VTDLNREAGIDLNTISMDFNLFHIRTMGKINYGQRENSKNQRLSKY